MFKFLENRCADGSGDGWICGILWNGSVVFLPDHSPGDPAADRLEGDRSDLLSAGDASGLHSLYSDGSYGKTASPDGTDVFVERKTNRI